MPLGPAAVYGLIQGGAALLGGLAQNIGQKRADKRLNEQNIELEKMRQKHNIDFWNMQNAYNTPAQQMARFREAGLNPHLIYGQGTPGNAQSIAPAATPKIQRGNYLQNTLGLDAQNMINTINTTKTTNKNLDLMDKEINLKRIQALRDGRRNNQEEELYQYTIDGEIAKANQEKWKAKSEEFPAFS